MRRLPSGSSARARPWREAIREAANDPRDYVSVGLSTAVAFTLFGYVLGRKADRLVELSETDPLTGLCNVRGLWDRLEVEFARARRYREPLALLLVDLDGLKRVNDRFGHDAGDEAIRRLADVIRSQLRRSDVAARWGGDEFAVLAPSTSRRSAVALAERIRALLPHQSTAWHVTGSLGVAIMDPRAGEDVEDSATLMRAADAALYEAKRTGRNKVVVAPPPDREVGDSDSATVHEPLHDDKRDRHEAPGHTRTVREFEIDRILAESFPASDPPPWTLGTTRRHEP